MQKSHVTESSKEQMNYCKMQSQRLKSEWRHADKKNKLSSTKLQANRQSDANLWNQDPEKDYYDWHKLQIIHVTENTEGRNLVS